MPRTYAPDEPEKLRRRIDRVRRFNRFYTQLIDVIDESHLDTPFTLGEARVLFELGRSDGPTASDLGRDLGLDAGYMSRMLRNFESKGLVERTTSLADGRQSHLRLTAAGRRICVDLNARTRQTIANLLRPLSDGQQREVVAAMRTVESALRAPAEAGEITLRTHRIGDMGFIISRQAELYHEEYGWSEAYEALTLRIVADFLDHFDPKLERCWVAEKEGEIVGSVFLIRDAEQEGLAKLRLLYVDPVARGAGLGRRLVAECTTFARRAGYNAITLWTNSVLISARRLYEAEGFRLIGEAKHHSFGHDLVGQTWRLDLADQAGAGARE